MKKILLVLLFTFLIRVTFSQTECQLDSAIKSSFLVKEKVKILNKRILKYNISDEELDEYYILNKWKIDQNQPQKRLVKSLLSRSVRVHRNKSVLFYCFDGDFIFVQIFYLKSDAMKQGYEDLRILNTSLHIKIKVLSQSIEVVECIAISS